jgi:hypothetical protein
MMFLCDMSVTRCIEGDGMTKTRVRTGSAIAVALAITTSGLLAAPAQAAEQPDTTGSFEFNCNGVPGGGARVSWERSGSTYTAVVDQYRLSPSNGGTNKNGEVLLELTGGGHLSKTGLTADGGWHDLGASATTTVASGASIEHAFTFVYAGFPTYPSCKASKWL